MKGWNTNNIGILIYLLLCPLLSYGQKEDRVWVLDDSIAIDFNNVTNPQVNNVGMCGQSGENDASISDSNGNLLYYIGKTSHVGGSVGQLSALYGNSQSIIPNGDSIASHVSITQGTLFIPSLSDSNIIYLFYLAINVSSNALVPSGFYYAIIDKSTNSCISKVNLLVEDTLCEKLTAVKHGNGTDWWILVHENESKKFYKFLLTNQGISGPYIQSIGPKLTNISQGQLKFSPNGNKLGLVSTDKHVSLFDFDRCSGLLSNFKDLGKTNGYGYGCSFSPSSEFFYVSTASPSDIGKDSIFQFDLNAGDILQSKLLLWTDKDSFAIGEHLLAPDGKIYIVTCYFGFPNSVHDSANMYLSVITKPDMLGVSCNFEPYSFYLNGRRTLYGLPNMVNYSLGVLAGSPCDTTGGIGINEVDEESNFKLYPNPTNSDLTIQYHLSGAGTLTIYNLLGQKEEEFVLGGNITKKNLSLNNLANGIYFCVMKDESGKMYQQKLVIEK